MSKIWEKDFWYSVCRPYVDWCTRTSFNRITVKGKENIPADAAIILAPNHCNTLMDALLVLQADRGPSAYGARADIFRKPKVAAILRWLRIVPIARKKDGLSAVSGNDEIFNEAVDCMDHGVPFCLFSEGTHQAKRTLLPLKKGIFRIAARAAEKLDKPVYIVPVGLEYDDYFRYMKNASVTFGEPIRVHADDDAMEVMATLRERLSNLITYFPDDENYEQSVALWEKGRKPHYTGARMALHVLLTLVTLPFFLLFAVLCCPMWITAAVIDRKTEDKAWMNTIRYCTKLGFVPVLTLLVGIPAFILLPWYWALLLLLLLLVSHSGFYWLQSRYRDLFESFK